MAPSEELETLRERHRVMLWLASAALILSGLLTVRSDERVAFFFLTQLPVPESCFAKVGLGVPCPGCGLTRSFISLAHGDIRAAWGYNRVGLLLALVACGQIPYRLWAMWHPTARPLGTVGPAALGYFLIACLLINWVIGFCL